MPDTYLGGGGKAQRKGLVNREFVVSGVIVHGRQVVGGRMGE